MNKNTLNRRDLVKAAGAVFALNLVRVATGNTLPSSGKIFMTSATRKHEASGALVFKPRQSGETPTDSVIVDLSTRFQPMLGFGSAYTDASCFLLSTMQPAARQAFLTETFSPQQMNLSLGRTSIGASDYSRDLYNYDDTAGDLSMSRFSIAHDEVYILPMLREMRRINPGLFLLSTPWSPPGWMKTYGSMLGGWMTYQYLAPYALYFSRFLDAYRAAGVPIDAVTSQNELETDQGGSMPATYWPPELEADFIRDHLGPLLKQKKDPAEIWLLDHNYDLWKRVRWQMQDAGLRKYVSGVAWHGYLGTPMSRLHDTEPQLPFYWTEGGPDITDPQYAYDWTRWGAIFSAAIRNWCRCIITWNLMLDSQGKPNIGPFSCGGLVTLKDDGSLEYSGQYWALRHFSQHVQRGALRVASHSDASELNHIAFLNPDSSHVLVLTNTGEERDLRLVYAGIETTIHLDKRSVTTVVS
jgi:glucosylceramidase